MPKTARQAMHDAERHARNMEEGNQFALSRAEYLLALAVRAYYAAPEPRVAQRLHVAIDRMAAFL